MEKVCPDCKTELKDVKAHSPCDTCRRNFCIEHGQDRRHALHPQHCQPGEW